MIYDLSKSLLRIKHYALILAALWLSPLVEGAGEVSAQIKLGVKGGVNLLYFSQDKEFLDAKYRSGFFVGPTLKADIPILPVGIDISLIYDQRTTDIESPYLSGGTETLRSRTLNIPLNLRYYIFELKDFNAYAKVGPQVTTYLGDKNIIEGIQDYKEEWNESDYSLNIGAGITVARKFEVSANCNIYCGKRASASFTDALEQTRQSIKHDMKKLAWQIGMAYYF